MTYVVSGRVRLGNVAIYALGTALAAAMFAGPACADPHFPISPRPINASNSLAGKIIFLDPGHQGYSTPELLHKKVSNGRGATKDCQTAGAVSVHGIAEHTINWKISQIIRKNLEARGARVFMSRINDTGWFGCITDRAEAVNRSNADLALSIHADSTSKGGDSAHRGFHLIVPTLPIPDQTANQVQSTKGLLASRDVRDAMKAARLPVANYISTSDGLSSRFDVAGPALTKVPLVFVEAGNLANPREASSLESAIGQRRYADAITAGVSQYLRSHASAVPFGQAIPPSLPIPPQITGDTTSFVDYFTNLVSNLGTRGANVINPNVINSSADGINPLGGTAFDAISQQLNNILSQFGGQAAPGASPNGIGTINSAFPGSPGYTDNPVSNNSLGQVNPALFNNPLFNALRNVPGVGVLLDAFSQGNVTPLANFLQSLVGTATSPVNTVH